MSLIQMIQPNKVNSRKRNIMKISIMTKYSCRLVNNAKIQVAILKDFQEMEGLVEFIKSNLRIQYLQLRHLEMTRIKIKNC